MRATQPSLSESGRIAGPTVPAVLLLALVPLLMAGCLGEPLGEPPVGAKVDPLGPPIVFGPGTEGAPGGHAPLEWAPCPLYTAEGTGKAWCATAALPLDWSQPQGRALDVFVKRLPAKSVRRGQVWLLAGGPGGAGDDLEWLGETLTFLAPDLDVYLPDHRGTGRSTRLHCPVQEALSSPSSRAIAASEWPACIQSLLAAWGSDLAHFSTTAAARDLGALMARTAVEGEASYVYGVSYGSYWAQRYLHFYPEQADGVVLDSVCPARGCYIAGYDQQFDTTAKDLLDLCAADDTCRTHLGAAPWQRAQAILGAVEAGHCSELAAAGLTRKHLRNMLGVLLTLWELRVYIPAVLHRVERCAPQDVAALRVLLELFEPPAAGQELPPSQQSTPLGTHVLLSEMYADGAPPRPEDLAAIAAGAVASLDAAPPLADLRPLWPRYDADAWTGLWPAPRTRVLMLNGTLDPQTPAALALLAADHLRGPAHRLVLLPGAAHGTVVSSPTLGSARPCGLQILLGFLADPGAALNLACLQDLAPVEFSGDYLLSMALFGTTQMWSPGAANLEQARETRRQLERQPVLRELRRRIAEVQRSGRW